MVPSLKIFRKLGSIFHFKSPDLHAPRNRKPAVNLLAYPNNDPYGFFAKMKKDHPDLRQFTNREIAGWLKNYLTLLAHEVIDNRHGVRLPGGLGAVIVGLTKPAENTARYNIDFATSKRLGLQVPYYGLPVMSRLLPSSYSLRHGGLRT